MTGRGEGRDSYHGGCELSGAGAAPNTHYSLRRLEGEDDGAAGEGDEQWREGRWRGGAGPSRGCQRKVGVPISLQHSFRTTAGATPAQILGSCSAPTRCTAHAIHSTLRRPYNSYGPGTHAQHTTNTPLIFGQDAATHGLCTLPGFKGNGVMARHPHLPRRPFSPCSTTRRHLALTCTSSGHLPPTLTILRSTSHEKIKYPLFAMIINGSPDYTQLSYAGDLTRMLLAALGEC